MVKMMKVYKMPWSLNAENILDDAIVIPKVINFSRVDSEHIEMLDEDSDIVTWRASAQMTVVYEVFIDVSAFNKRVIPLTAFKHVVPLDLKKLTTLHPSDCVDYLVDCKEVEQDFKKGRVAYVDVD